MKFSQRLLNAPLSPIRKLVPFAESAKAKGIKVYHLNIGDPDIETPAVMLSALHNFQPKVIRYANSKGEKVFLEALLSYYHGLGFKDLSLQNIQVTQGGSEALLWAFLAVANPGEEIIVFEPFYANYRSYAAISGVKLKPILTKIESGFHLPKISEIEKKISKKTRAILICNPNNPTGTIYTKKELAGLINLAKKHKLYLLSDEVYREFAYDGKKQISALNFNYPEGIIMLDSLSKRYSLCGIRLGAVVTRNKDFISQILRFAQGRLSAGFVDQIVAAKLTAVPQSYIKKVQTEYQKRRDLVIRELNKTPGVVCKKPEGAFYIIAKLPVSDSEKFAKFLLTDFSDQKETVMVAPAAGFYETPGLGTNEVRIAYVINRKDLKRALNLLKKAIVQFNNN